MIILRIPKFLTSIISFFILFPLFGQETFVPRHESYKDYDKTLFQELRTEYLLSLSSREKRVENKINYKISISNKVLEVTAFHDKRSRNRYIDISTGLLDVLHEAADIATIEDLFPDREGITFRYIHYYLWPNSAEPLTAVEYAKLTDQELKRFNAEENASLSEQLFRYSVGFVLLHELSHHLKRHFTRRSKLSSLEKEKEADRLALDIFQRLEWFPIYASTPLLVFYFNDTDAVANSEYRTHPADIDRLIIVFSEQSKDLEELYDTVDDPQKKARIKQLIEFMQEEVNRFTRYLSQDKTRTTEWYLKKAKEGMIYAQTRVGHLYFFGERGLDQNPDKSMYWFHKAAKQGDAYAQYRLGQMYEAYKYDEETAIYWYHESAKQGNFFSQQSLKRLRPEYSIDK